MEKNQTPPKNPVDVDESIFNYSINAEYPVVKTTSPFSGDFIVQSVSTHPTMIADEGMGYCIEFTGKSEKLNLTGSIKCTDINTVLSEGRQLERIFDKYKIDGKNALEQFRSYLGWEHPECDCGQEKIFNRVEEEWFCTICEWG